MVLHNNYYVSYYPGTVTQIEAPAIALLAHNNSDGQYFKDIEKGTEIYYGETYVVTDIWYTSIGYVPPEIYDPDKLLLITCLKAGNDWAAGRLIIIAEKP